MTVASDVSDIEYDGDGSTTVFDIPFNFDSNADIEVATRDSTGDSTVITTGFSITGGGTGSGGTCTFTTAPASGTSVVITRAPQIVQSADYADNDAFPAATHEAALDAQTYVAQYLRALIKRCIQVPAGDSTIGDSAILPGVSTRKGKLLYFDETTGVPEPMDLAEVSGLSSPISQSIIGSTLWPRTAAEISAGVTPTYYYYQPGDIRRYGAVGDGSTNDYTAWSNAALVGGEIVIPENFNSAIASASLSSSGIALLSNTVIRGAGRDTSKITVTGTTACNLFRAINKSGLEILDLCVRQNNTNTSSALGEILYFEMTSGASSAGGKVRIARCRFENCKGDNWIGFYNASGTYDLVDLRVESCDFYSESGNARGPTSSGVSSSCVTFGDSAQAAAGRIKDFQVNNCTFYGAHIKTAVECWQQATVGQIKGNICESFHSGAAFSSEDVGLYALLVYRGGSATVTPSLIEFDNNTINGCVDCGVYVQAATHVTLRNTTVLNQTGSADGTLFKGAIAINNGSINDAKTTIDGTVASNCRRGIGAVVSDGSVTKITNTTITAQPNSAKGLRISSVSGETTGEIYVDGAVISGSGTTCYGIEVDLGSTYGLKTLHISNFDVQASSAPMRFIRGDATTPVLGYLRVANGALRGGSAYGLQFENYSNTSQRAVFESISFAGGFGSTAYAFSVDGSVGIDAHDLTFQDITGGSQYAVSGGGATGTLDRIRYQNVAAAQRVRNSGGTDLGRSTPTHSGSQGDFIQNLAVADRDASNMILNGWQNYNGSTGWRTMYTSTVSPAT